MRKAAALALTLSLATLGTAYAEDVVTIASNLNPPTLDPSKMMNGFVFAVTNHVFDTLMTRNPDGSLKGRLATSWKQVTPTTWRFELRKNVKFHDGTPFNAQTVKFSIDRLNSKEYASGAVTLVNMIKTVKVVDNDTVDIITDYPFAALAANLTHPATAMMSATALKDPGYARNPIGTGPFKFSKWNVGSSVELVANPDYWGGKPAIDKVVFRIIPDVATQVVELRTGKIDLLPFVPPESVKDIEATNTLSMYKKPGFTVAYVGYNTQNGITKNPKVRQAISMAIDRDMIVNELRQKLAEKTNIVIADQVFGAGKNIQLPAYNLAAAKKLLAEAGVKPGTKIRLATWEGAEYRQLAEATQFALQQLGLDASVQVLPDFAAFTNAMQKPDHAEVFVTAWATVTMDADVTLYSLFRQGEGENWTFYKNAAVSKLLLDARRTNSTEKRLSMYQNVQQQLAKDLPVFPLYAPFSVYAKNKRLQGEGWYYAWIYLDLSKATVK